MTTCSTCRKDYDETDVEEVRYHSESVDCHQSCRCTGKPRCYMCRGSFCVCAAH